MKTTIIGNLSKVEAVETKENYSQQKIEITVQEYDSTSGSAFPPQVFPITIFNKKISELKADTLLAKRVRAGCWLKSLKNEKDDKVFYNVALNATSLEIC